MERGGVEVNLKHLIKYFTEQNIKVSLISSKLNLDNIKIKKKIYILLKQNLDLNLCCCLTDC